MHFKCVCHVIHYYFKKCGLNFYIHLKYMQKNTFFKDFFRNGIFYVLVFFIDLGPDHVQMTKVNCKDFQLLT